MNKKTIKKFSKMIESSGLFSKNNRIFFEKIWLKIQLIMDQKGALLSSRYQFSYGF